VSHDEEAKPSIDDYLMSAWMQKSPGYDKRKAGFGVPNGFWPDLARLAYEQAMSALSHEELKALEAAAAERYKTDHVFAVEADNYITQGSNPARWRQISQGKKSKAELTQDILGEISFD
jgi:hypothetical protein